MRAHLSTHQNLLKSECFILYNFFCFVFTLNRKKLYGRRMFHKVRPLFFHARNTYTRFVHEILYINILFSDFLFAGNFFSVPLLVRWIHTESHKSWNLLKQEIQLCFREKPLFQLSSKASPLPNLPLSWLDQTALHLRQSNRIFGSFNDFFRRSLEIS